MLDSGTIRPASAADLDQILRLNSEWEHFTCPLSRHRLAELDAIAAYHRVYERDSRIAAFLLAFSPGLEYDSVNYRWFNDRYDDFIYIDRIVIDSAFQRRGLGEALYRDLHAFAQRTGVTRLVCEVDVDPLNAASDRFHAARGFLEVGTQWVSDGTKRVSLRECPVAQR